jgi:hypothetical protein
MKPETPGNPAPIFPPPAAEKSSAVVGGFPWSVDQAGAEQPAAIDLGGQIIGGDAARDQNPVAGPAEPLSWPVVRERIERFVEKSPAFSVSLALHACILLVLALFVIRQEKRERLRLDLSFGTTQGESGEAEGGKEVVAPVVVEIEKPVEQPETAVAKVAPASTPPPPALPVEPAAEEMTAAADGKAAAATAVAIGELLTGRLATSREKLLGAAGGSDATESAVSLALDWIARQQKKDGLWSLQGPYVDGGSQENRLAATAMALMALQGAGNTTREGPHAAAVAKAWKPLLRAQTPEGTFELGSMLEQHAMYAHAQATIAVCEIYGMTKDPAFEEPARRALAYAIKAQMPDGGWRYHLPQPDHENRGDMSVTGWYLVALKTGEMAGLEVPAAAYERLAEFLDRVFVSPERGYGYQISPNQKFFEFRPALTAEGLLCRQYLGWRRDDPRLAAGVDLLLREAPIDFDYRKKNVYAWYYATQVFHHMDGAEWTTWNRRMQDQLPANQVRAGREKGSWDPANDQWGHVGGRLYVTALCACMLEVYYRHLPLYSEPER